MKYLEDILHVKVKYQNVMDTANLPYLLTDSYKLKFASIENFKMLFLYLNPADNTFQWRELKKHTEIFRQKFGIPVVLILSHVNAYERNVLINNFQPFVVENNQIYLPFLGLMLQESFKNKSKKVLTPIAQLIFLYFIYCDKNKLYIDDVKDEILLTNMTLSRAFKQIENLDEIFTGKDGVKKFIYVNKSKKEIFELNKQYFTNPVRRKIYVDNHNDFMKLNPIISGELALSKYSMLATPNLNTYALKADIKDIKYAQYNLFDPNKQDCIEIWKYDPTILSKIFFDGKVIDFLSLYTSMDNSDERIDKELENSYINFWKANND